VSFGYADSERANASQFPTPWAGDPGVIFEGCTPATSATGKCVFDASAVKIDNNTGSSEVVESVMIKFPGALAGGADCIIDIWPHNVTLPAGQSLIVTQTSGSPSETGCGQPVGTLDGSEVGPNGVDWGGQTHCATNSGIIPHILLQIKNQPLVDATDNNQVLNTGGNDSANCPSRINPPHLNNESESWGQCIGQNKLVLAPPTQTHVVGNTATIVATLTNTCDNAPVQGANIHFGDQSGPDNGLNQTAKTGAAGKATIKYIGLTDGTDVWGSDTTNPAGTIFSNTVNVIWTPLINTGQKLTVHDVADVQGFKSGGSGGTVDFQLFTNAGCTGSPLFDSGNKAVDTSTGTANSGNFSVPFTNTNTTYNWLVTYSGDAVNAGSTSPCGTENFSVAGNSLPSGVDP
jgi:hypothetical protein